MLQYFRPSLSYRLSLRSLFCLFLSDRFTQVLLYVGSLTVIAFMKIVCVCVFYIVCKNIILCILECHLPTVLPAKSDSDVIFCLQNYQGLRIDSSLVYQSYPQDMINTQVIYRFASAQVKCTHGCLLSNCKQTITSLSLLVGTTVAYFWYIVGDNPVAPIRLNSRDVKQSLTTVIADHYHYNH